MNLKLFCFVIVLGVGLCVIAADEAGTPSGDVNKPKDDNVGTKHSTETPTSPINEKKVTTPAVENTSKVNSTADNDNELKGQPGWYQKVMENKGMLMRTFYVLIGVTSIVVLYFVIRAWRTRRRHSKSRKYGLITSSGADMEMEPLDQDDDDEDEMTMFERRR